LNEKTTDHKALRLELSQMLLRRQEGRFQGPTGEALSVFSFAPPNGMSCEITTRAKMLTTLNFADNFLR
jgi:hypothetical protein